jgi:hypothetical protein
MTDPSHLVRNARSGNCVVGWRLAEPDRAPLLQRFVARYQRTVADHVTLAANVAPGTDLPDPVSAEIVGRTDDGKGVEALVVAIDGSTDRPDGSIYHLTWSLEGDRTAQESNDVLRAQGWTPLDEPLPITLIPDRLG